MWPTIMIFVVATLLSTWFIFGIVWPIARAFKHNNSIPVFSIIFLMSVGLIAPSALYDFGYYDIVDGRYFGTSTTIWEWLLVMTVSPIVLLWAMIESSTALTSGTMPIFQTVFLSSILIVIFIARKLKARAAIGLALASPLAILLLATAVQAPITDGYVKKSFEKLGAECLDHTQLFTYVWSPNYPNNNGYHTVARKNGEFYNWSYRKNDWDLVPASYIDWVRYGACRETNQ